MVDIKVHPLAHVDTVASHGAEVKMAKKPFLNSTEPIFSDQLRRLLRLEPLVSCPI
jgi:hypothetical protein